jgi:hypothetical protein
LHDVTLHEVAFSGAPPGMLQGEALVQICTDLTGSAEVGPYVGTARGPPVLVGEVPGVVRGDAVAWPLVVGVGRTWLTGLPGRLSTKTPTTPSRMMMTTATAAGTSHAGRSGGRPPPDDGRATEGLRAGAEIGARATGGAVGAF